MDILRATTIVGVACVLLPAIFLAGPAQSGEPLWKKGRALAQANCSGCHNISAYGRSPLPPAPPFRIIARMYNPRDIQWALAEGIVYRHPVANDLKMRAGDAAALTVFIGNIGP